MKKVLLSSFALVLIALTSWAIATKSAAPMKAEAELNLVDATSQIVNPSFDEGTNGWTVNTGKIEVKSATTGNPVVTAYNYQVNISQHITGLTPGTYILKVQACSRYMDKKAGITDYESKVGSGTAIPNEAYIFANGVEQKIKNIYDETSSYDFYNNLSSSKKSQISADDITMSNGEQIPYDSDNLSYAFGTLGMYENELQFTVAENGAASIGIKNELSGSSYKPYIGYDNFRLYRIDNGETPTTPTEPEPDPEETTEPDEPSGPTGPVELYNLNAPAGTLVPVCMPYAVKSEYFGQVYQIGSIQDGKAYIVPVNEVATGVPCVVKSKGSSSITSATTNYNTKPTIYSLWDNTSITVKNNFTGFTWTATDIYNNKYDASDLTFVEGDLTNLEFTASIENNAVARFWAQNPIYLTETTSTVGNYLSLPVYTVDKDGYRRDKPNPVLVPVVVSNKSQTISYSQNKDLTEAKTVTVAANANVAEIYELIPGLTYYYKSADGKSAGKFKVSGTIRMINIGTNVVNMRDLGGKQGFGGKYVRYGKLYRSAECKGSTCNINDTEKAGLVALGIGAELDLRNTDGGTSKAWIPNLVNNDNYFYAQNSSIIANGPARLYETSTINMLKKEFAFLFDNLITKGRAVQFHCRIGADRTGLFAFLIQGILGVSESDILREYELTSFSSAGLRTKAQGDGDGGNYQTELPKIKAKYPGKTFTEMFEEYFTKTLGITEEQIKEFRNIMLVESLSPEEEVDPEDQEAQAAANTFNETYKSVIDIKVEDVKSSDLENINAALTAFEGLSQPAKDLLTTEKGKLDQLQAAAEAKKKAEEEAAKVQAEVEKFNETYKSVIDIKVEDVKSSDLDNINAALTAFEGLSQPAKDLLTTEKGKLDQLQAAAEAKKKAEEEAAKVQAEVEKFNETYKSVIDIKVEDVKSSDLDNINAALTAFEELSQPAKDLLTTEKSKLDALQAAADAKKKAEEEAAKVQAEIDNFNSENADILDKTPETVEYDDLADIENALADYNNLSEKAQEALTNEKNLLDELKEAAQTKKPQEGEDPSVIAEKKKVVEGLIEEVDAKITKWRKYNVGTAWGQYTCIHPEYITAAEAEVVKAEELIVGEPSIKELDDEIYALNESSAALDKVKMTLNMTPFFYIKSKNNKYITLWPGTGKKSAMSKTGEEEQLGDEADWIMYGVTTNYSIFTFKNGNIVQVLPDDDYYPGFGFAVDGNEVAPFNSNIKSINDPAEFTPIGDAESVNIIVGDSAISSSGIKVSAVDIQYAGEAETFEVEALTANNPPVAGINDIKADVQNGNVYNIAGQRVGDNYQGIIIRDGKRLLVK